MTDTSLDGDLISQLPTPYRVDTLQFVDPATGAPATAHPTADFLKAFEAVLISGVPSAQNAAAPSLLGIEQIIEKLATYFVAGAGSATSQPQTPEDFLPWLGSWLAFSMRADLPRKARRDFLNNLSIMYRERGTQENLKRVLEYFTGLPSTESTVTLAAEAHCFEVRVDLSKLISERNLGDVPRLVEIVHALIRREKPAHTRYVLAPSFPSFRLGELNADNTVKTSFFARVHGYVPGPQDGSTMLEVGNTLLGVNMWEA